MDNMERNNQNKPLHDTQTPHDGRPSQDTRVPRDARVSHDSRVSMDKNISDELEVLRIMAAYSQEAKAKSTIVPPDELPQTPSKTETASANIVAPETENTFLVAGDDSINEESNESSSFVSHIRVFGKKLKNGLLGLLPSKGDQPLEIMRKCLFLISFITLVGTSCYLIYDMAILPAATDHLYSQIDNLYDPEHPAKVPPGYEDVKFPDGMTDVLKALYAQNQDTRGYLVYESKNNDFLKIRYPVMYKNNNDYYLYRDFHKSHNKHGSLFFDYRNNYDTKDSVNKSSIIYGHNMINGQMLSNLNQLINNVSKVRAAPTFTLETLFDQRQYKVFAVAMFDENEKLEDEYHYYYCRTSFSGDEDFMNFVGDIRARSMWDYPVDVTAQDEIMILSTCTTKSSVKIDEGRLAVFARRVRDGESTSVDTNKIVKNDDAIMPYYWYVNNKKPIHPYYATVGQNTTTTTTNKTGTSKPIPTGSSNNTTLTVPVSGGTTITASNTTAATTSGGTTVTTKSTNPGKTTTTAKNPSKTTGKTTTTVKPDGTTTEAPTETTEKPAETTEKPTDPTDPKEPDDSKPEE